MSRERLVGIGAHRLSELVDVRVREPDALVVGDDHEQHVCPLLHLRCDELELTVGQLFGESRALGQTGVVVAGDVRPNCRRERQHSGHVECALTDLGPDPLMAGEREQPARETDGEDHYGDLQQQHLGGEPHVEAGRESHAPSVRRAREQNAQKR